MNSENKMEILSELDTNRLRDQYRLRFCHFHELKTGRLVATLATQNQPDGTINAAVAFSHPSQGRSVAVDATGKTIVEAPPTRKLGRLYSLGRLMRGNKDGEVLTTVEAVYLLASGPNSVLRGKPRSPKDICVVNFTQEELSKAISSRTILSFFPGSKWVPALRPSRAFEPRRARSIVPAPRSFLSRLSRYFNGDQRDRKIS